MSGLSALLRPFGFVVETQKDTDGAVREREGEGTGVEWWQEDLYVRVPRWRVIKWRGRTVVRIPYRESIVGNYFKPADDLVRLVHEMAARGVIPRLSAGSRVFEPGCNVGRNLWWLKQAFDCEVVGMDISSRAVEIASKRIWKGVPRADFSVGNVLEAGALSRFPDRYFDLVLTRWHLVHVPACPQKTAYMRELRRIGKAGLILEPVRVGGVGRIEWADRRTYCLSWDDWEGWYGIKRILPRVPLVDTEVFYWSEGP